MSIKVRFFASLADSVGRREAECPYVPGMTVEGAWQAVNGDKALPTGALVAINHDYCTLEQALNDNDEVAYFPPVTGG